MMARQASRVQLELDQLAQQETREPREGGQPQRMFKFFQLPVHTLGINLPAQNLFMLQLLVAVEVGGLDK